MMISKKILLIFALISLIHQIQSNQDHHNEYTREWAVKVSDAYNADLIALETGFQNKGLVILNWKEIKFILTILIFWNYLLKIAPFKDVYLFVNNKLPSRSKRSADKHTDRLQKHESVSII